MKFRWYSKYFLSFFSASGYYAYFESSAWVNCLLWIFLVIPLTVFTYWIYEPKFLLDIRIALWEKMCGMYSARARNRNMSKNVSHRSSV